MTDQASEVRIEAHEGEESSLVVSLRYGKRCRVKNHLGTRNNASSERMSNDMSVMESLCLATPTIPDMISSR